MVSSCCVSARLERKLHGLQFAFLPFIHPRLSMHAHEWSFIQSGTDEPPTKRLRSEEEHASRNEQQPRQRLSGCTPATPHCERAVDDDFLVFVSSSEQDDEESLDFSGHAAAPVTTCDPRHNQDENTTSHLRNTSCERPWELIGSSEDEDENATNDCSHHPHSSQVEFAFGVVPQRKAAAAATAALQLMHAGNVWFNSGHSIPRYASGNSRTAGAGHHAVARRKLSASASSVQQTSVKAMVANRDGQEKTANVPKATGAASGAGGLKQRMPRVNDHDKKKCRQCRLTG